MFDSNFLKELSVVDWGYSEQALAQSYKHYNKWVEEGKHQPLHYLADERKLKRESLKSYYPEYQSSLSFLFSYREKREELKNFYESSESNGLKIGSYVFAFNDEDYHFKIKESLESIIQHLKKTDPTIEASLALDIQPVLDRDLAYRSGLGWFGKNSMLIHPKHGSFFLIGSLLLSKKLNLTQKKVESDHCGQCTKCIDLCPTEAIDPESKTLIASKCISTWTIEVFKPDIMEPPQSMDKASGEIFGCDICQDVCPWNLRLERVEPIEKKLNVKDSKVASFFLMNPITDIISELESWSNKKFQKFFKGTALQRTGRVGLLKNLNFWKKRNQDL